MPKSRAFVLIALAACEIVVLSSCKKKERPHLEQANQAPAQNMKTALADFQREIDGVADWIQAQREVTSKDPAAGVAVLSEIVSKISAIRADNLPPDLKAAWTELMGPIVEMRYLFANLPDKKLQNPDEALTQLGQLIPGIAAIQERMLPILQNLDTVGRKYGLDVTKIFPSR